MSPQTIGVDISKVETLLPSLEAPNNCVDRHRINLSQSLIKELSQVMEFQFQELSKLKDTKQ